MAADRPGRSAASRVPRGPYPGLRPFLDHESQLLMGREAQVRQIVERLESTQFVAVIGGSGSGKSSLIRAGVVPELWGGGIPQAGKYWVPVICTPGTAPGGEGAGTPARAAATEGQARPADTGAADGSTPITRLAWKLSTVLAPEASEAEQAARRQEIAAVFRQPGGFSRLVDLYSPNLPPRGPDRATAQFLFVIDQFEELFDPSNKRPAGAADPATGAPPTRWHDAERMVEAVIDHFFAPHPRCHVVLTMRSERLADCAGYLELPDAINKASYLVRRLGRDELFDAIVGPAKSYLRLLRRNEDDEPADRPAALRLPGDVDFEPAVIERLADDVEQLKDNPDHLPLLQHVLARTWEAACTEAGIATDRVPPRLCWRHLEAAVDAGRGVDGKGRAEGWLHGDAGLNCLQHSLENWAQRTYDSRSPEDRERLDRLLGRLGYKDPNNGLYFQMRVDVHDPKLFTGLADPAPVLRPLLERGFLDSVNYMFWDTEDKAHVTLKVSHEAFIRGWAHFRGLVDREAERFDEFVSLLKRCAEWQRQGEPLRLLLADTELARLEQRELLPVVADRSDAGGWYRVLRLARDGAGLAAQRDAVALYVERSEKRLADERQRHADDAERQRQVELNAARAEAEVLAERAERQRAVAERQKAESDRQKAQADRQKAEADKQKAEAEKLRADAEVQAARAERERAEAQAQKAQADQQRAQAVASRIRAWRGIYAGGALMLALVATGLFFVARILQPSLEAIADFNEGRQLAERRPQSFAEPTLLADELDTLLHAAEKVEHAGTHAVGLRERSLTVLALARDTERQVRNATSEAAVNALLRKVLNDRIWSAGSVDEKAPAAALPASVTVEKDCPADGPVAKAITVSLEPPRRTIIVRAGRPTPHTSGSGDIDFFDTNDPTPDPCTGNAERFWSVPGDQQPVVVLSADLERIVVKTQPQGSRPAVTLYGLDWELRDNELRARVGGAQTVAPGDTYAAMLGKASEGLDVVAPDPGGNPVDGTLVHHLGHRFRYFPTTAAPLPAGPGAAGAVDGWTLLSDNDEASKACQALALDGAFFGLGAAGAPDAAARAPTASTAGRAAAPVPLLFGLKAHCVHVASIAASPDGRGAAGACAADGSTCPRWLVANVYVNPPKGADTRNAQMNPVASVPLGWFLPGERRWYADEREGSRTQGWLAMRDTRTGANGAPAPAWAAPWSTAALVRRGQPLLAPAQAFVAAVKGAIAASAAAPDPAKPR